ncbi:MAG: TonB-dependent receptor, partial [Acidobacteria bacterium]|nr:TonB-dependent receptor [Acidobacteriota bacterium]
FRSELLANVFLVKSDWIVSPQHTLSARYNFQHLGGSNNVFFDLTNPITFFAIDTNATGKVRTGSLVTSLTSILGSQSLNEFRFQFAYDNQDNVANSDSTGARVTGVISGFGRGTTEPRYTREKRFQFVDNFSLNRGRHEFKTGVDLSVIKIENFFPGTFGGRFTFASIADFANNRVQTFEQNFGDPTTNPNTLQYAGFVQDNWRVLSNLNLSFGLRYELETYDTSQLVANPLYPNTGQIPLDKNNWAPRFGFSWSPERFNKTVVRGGYGLFYGRTAQVITSTAISGNGLRTQRFTLSGSNAAQAPFIPTYPNRLSAPPNVAALRSDIFVFAPDFVNPYVQQGSLAIERRLANNFQVAGTYIVVKGTRLNRSRDVNLAPPVAVAVPVLSGASQVGTGIVQQFPTARPLAAIGAINTFESAASSIYHGMIVSMNKRWSQNYQFQLSYTLSKTIDDGPDALIVTRTGRIQNAYNAHDERALSVTDQRHRFVFSWTYSPQFGSLDGAASHLFNGWKFGAISTLGSGRPLDAQTTNDPNRDANFQNDRTPGLGRNVFKGLGFNSHDFRITRVFRLKERSRIEFLTEFFNVFNHPNLLFGRDDDGYFRTHSTYSATDRTFALTTPFPLANQAFNSRQIQFALKYIF